MFSASFGGLRSALLVKILNFFRLADVTDEKTKFTRCSLAGPLRQACSRTDDDCAGRHPPFAGTVVPEPTRDRGRLDEAEPDAERGSGDDLISGTEAASALYAGDSV